MRKVRTTAAVYSQVPRAALALGLVFALVLQPCCVTWAAWFHDDAEHATEHLAWDSWDAPTTDKLHELCAADQPASVDADAFVPTESKSEFSSRDDSSLRLLADGGKESVLPISHLRLASGSSLYLRFQRFLE